jgi:LmbE family N-acetylglucosaminyl deacetylase
MAVLAHPDDETFGLGRTIATYARRGRDVYYVRDGRQIGTVDEEILRQRHSRAALVN